MIGLRGVAGLVLLTALGACSGDDAIDLFAGGDAGAGCGECVGEEPFCSAALGRCVECLEPSQCDVGETCDGAIGACVEACSATEPCTSGDRPICDPVRQVCIQCQSDADCSSGERPRCLTTAGVCVECLSAVDCQISSEPICDAVEHECRGP